MRLKRVTDMRRHVPITAAGLHGVQGCGVGQRKLVQMTLKLAVAPESEPADDAHDRRGISAKARRHGADAEENILAGLLQDGSNNFLALDAQFFEWLREMRGAGRGGGLFAFHQARELPNSARLSTALVRHKIGNFR